MPRRYYAVLTLITLAAAFLRLWRLTEVPPGLHYDLAATALLGNDVAFHGYRPIFISAYTGHEALFYYWLALWFRLAGSSIFTLRLAAATLGILAVPAAWFALRALWRLVDEEAAQPIAALGAAFLAAAFFHVVFSRFGFRVILEPVVQSLALGFLFRGLRLLQRNPHPRLNLSATPDGPSSFARRLSSYSQSPLLNLTIAGAFTALAAYTYLAARLFPVPLALFWLALLLGAWRARRLRPVALGFGVFTLAALVVFAPLGLYFLQHPEDFFNRAGQVVPRPGETELLLLGFRRAAEMLFLNGEPYDRFNLPGLPLLSPLVGLFFVLGLFLTIRDLILSLTRTPRHPHPPTPTPPHPHTSIPPHTHTALHLLLLAWLPALLLPTALSVHDIFPSNVRAFGLIPLLFFFPARGLVAAYRGLQRFWPGPLLPTAYPMAYLILLVLALSTGLTGRQYFREWAALPNQRLNNDADLTAIAAYLNDADLTGTSVYVSTIHYRHPTFAYLLEDFAAVRWLTGGTALAFPAEGAALYVFARSTPPPEDWIAAWEPYLVAAPLDPDGQPAFRAYRFAPSQAPPRPALTPVEANFSNLAALTGYRVLTSTTALTLDLQWHIENPAPAGDFLPHARLDDTWDQPWSQSPGFNYPSEQWVPGDTLLTRLTIPLPAGLPPGAYTLKAGLYSAGTDTLLARLSPQGEYAGNRLALPPVTLAAGAAADPNALLAENAVTPPLSLPASLSGDLSLLGYSAPTLTPRQGELLPLALYWSARQPAPAAALTLRLGDALLYAGQPVRGTFPFAEWMPGQLVLDRYQVRLPAAFPPGPAPLTLEVTGRGTASLATLDVQRVDRLFDPPAVAVPLDALFGDGLALHGYTLAPGSTTTLTLAWHSLALTDRRYTVFVHILDAAGQLIAQADSEPQSGRYATSLWQTGEYILDDYAFTLAPGTYAIRLGLYLPETGQRLPVAGGDYFELPEFDVP